MFDPKAEKDEKLRQLRADFEACIDAAVDAQNEAHRAARFYHNTNGEGQWEAGDLETLREQGRVAFTFNLIKAKINTGLGMVKERRRKPHAAAVGGEDAMTAEVLNSLMDRVYEIADIESIESDVLKQGTVTSQHSVRIEVETDPENPLFKIIRARGIRFNELDWDPASWLLDRSDARYVFWHKWLSKAEFNRLYPDSDFKDLLAKADIESANNRLGEDRSEGGPISGSEDDGDMYANQRWEQDYYDRKRDKIRVIHAEYKVPKQRYFLVQEEAGISEEASEDVATNLEQYQAAGYLAGLTATSTWSDAVHTVQFVGNEVLFDAPLDQPYDGFSFVPYTYAIDSETGNSYGPVRDLIDPQQEVNKANSLSLENIAGQSKTGTIAEKSAIEDIATFEDQLKTTASVAIVKDGALTQQKVIQRQPTQMSPAVSQRMQDGVAMLDKISNIHTEETSPAGSAEAAATVQLRHRKSQLSMDAPVESFEKHQKGVAQRIIQTIIRAFPDAQIAEYLGNNEKYVVQQGTIIELDAATGQPKGMVKLEQMRTLRYDVKLEISSENTTERLMEFQGLSGLQQIAPGYVDPSVLMESVTADRSKRERLKTYAEQKQKSDQEQAQRQAQAMEAEAMRANAQIASTIDIAAGEAHEKGRHNRAGEQLDFLKQQGDQAVRLAGVLEKADAGEKAVVLQLAEILERRQMQRESIQAQYTQGGGNNG